MVAKRRRAISVISSHANPYSKGLLNSKGSLNESGVLHFNVLFSRTLIAVSNVTYLKSRVVSMLFIRSGIFRQPIPSPRVIPRRAASFQGVCPKCGASGPRRESHQEALRAWNGRE